MSKPMKKPSYYQNEAHHPATSLVKFCRLSEVMEVDYDEVTYFS